ncbi:LysE family transporter [Halomonas coralii]|nr:LysE family transporter [Modicisalibacter sp. R2A 31.J]MBZ9573512.1 LysE family transporter [Modicisalibacter sp. MOD 31.J]
MLRDDGVLAVDADRRPRSPGRLLGMGLWLNLLNPKLGLFFVAFLPQFVPANAERAQATFFLLGLVFAGMTLVVFIGYGLLAAWVRDHVIGKPAVMRGIRWGFATAFLLLGVQLGLGAI